MNEKVLYNKLRYLIQNKKNFSEICKELDLKDYEVMYLIGVMERAGTSLTIVNGEIVKHKRPNPICEPYNITTDKSHIKMGLLGDTHLASIGDDIPTLEFIYDKAEDKNVDYMLHCGDLTDGVLGILGYENYLKEDTYTGQTKYAIDRYPRYSGKTYAISGNHDDYWTMLTGKEIISDISKNRNDIVYLGGNRRLVNINGLKIQIMHGDVDPNKYWFREAKYLASIPTEERPHILHVGHRHSSRYDIINSTHSVRSASITNRIEYPGNTSFKNEKTMYWANIYFDDNGMPAEINVEKESFSK